ncbi:PilZ domain-containing protein [Desulfuromonas sp. KJ2020]|uniref:flagellar brake protein n=1 Tax=Desulfuromonas sp. KJ2020 TaxID=2919173 RepID=UPI0020A7209C|nr:PilZ domain-containing protein [Desulfuromonas sp. KJ2020]
MSSLTLLSHLQDSKVVRVFVPLKNGDRKRLDGVAKVVNDTLVEVSFLPDQLPVSDIEILQKALISLDTGDGTLSLNCSIEKIVSDEKLLLMATESISHEQKREWFRVDGNFAVKYWPVTEKGAPSGDTATGETIDISGGGVRLAVKECLPVRTRLRMEIEMAEHGEKVTCIGRVMRVIRTFSGRSQMGVQFEDMENEERDKIVAFCLAEQRRQLRLKVQVVGTV